MKDGIVISDAGPIFSLALIDCLNILSELFGDVYIPNAVWEELSKDKTSQYYQQITTFFKDRVKPISGFNELSFIMDYGESESVTLYRELNANFLLIDDKKARTIAEALNIHCIGTLGVLIIAKERRLIDQLRPFFKMFLANKRYYSLKLLNMILINQQEEIIS